MTQAEPCSSLQPAPKAELKAAAQRIPSREPLTFEGCQQCVGPVLDSPPRPMKVKCYPGLGTQVLETVLTRLASAKGCTGK